MNRLDAPASAVEAGVLREVCGHWTTGIAVVTGRNSEDTLHGMAVNSFTSVSLDPPLILFCPALTSSTWAAIRDSGRFAVHVLAEDQKDIAYSFARTGGDKFVGVPLTQTDDGLPAIDGVAARLVCNTESILPAGDHDIVVGRVVSAQHGTPRASLLFHRGRIIDPRQEGALLDVQQGRH